MNSNAVTYTQKKNAATVSQDFIAAADVQQIHIISMELSQMRMTLDVSCRRSVLNVL